MKRISITSFLLLVFCVLVSCKEDEADEPQLSQATYSVTVSGGPLNGRTFTGTADPEQYISLTVISQEVGLSGVSATIQDLTTESMVLIGMTFPANPGSSFTGTFTEDTDTSADDQQESAFLFLTLDTGVGVTSYYSVDADYQVRNYSFNRISTSQGNEIGTSSMDIEFNGTFEDGLNEDEQVQIRGTIRVVQNLN